MILSDKYIAGFLDADGSIYVQRNKLLCVEFYQKQSNDGVINMIRDRLVPGSKIYTKCGKRRGMLSIASRLSITGQRAVDIACRLKPYIVTKRARLNRFLSELEFTERIGTNSMPIHPTRKWLAGYFDGDGCIHASVCRNGGSASISLSIDGHSSEIEGLLLVKKAFGGRIFKRGDNGSRWEIKADAAKSKAFLGYFAKHLIIKREQAYFILGCAAMGHFRDGETIHDVLRVMKAHPHRLSDLTASVDVTKDLALVRNIQSSPGHSYKHFHGQKCSSCGSTEIYALGMCNPCWQKDRYYVKKTTQAEATVGHLYI